MNLLNKYKVIDQKTKTGFLTLFSIILAYFIDFTFFLNKEGSFDRFILFTLGNMFLSLHMIVKIKDLYNFIYLKRYLIWAIFMTFVVINGYHGSSIGEYDHYVQPNSYVSDAIPFLGETRSIRGDEWRVTTPLIVSQTLPEVNFSNKNPLIMGNGSNVNLFPQLPTRNSSILSNLFMAGFLFLNKEMGFSFYWYGRLIAMFFSSFELSMLITKKNKLYALLGAVLITFSPATQWWYPMVILMYGQFAVVFIDHFLKAKTWKQKIVFTGLLTLAGSGYIMAAYPAWQVPLGYVFFGLIVWLLIENNYKFRLSDLYYFFTTIVLILMIITPAIINSREVIIATLATVYPGSRFMTGGYGWQKLFENFNALYFSFKTSPNSSEFSQFIGFFPIPFVMGGWYSFRNWVQKKGDSLLNILLLLIIAIGYWNFFELPHLLAKITLLYLSMPERTSIIIGLICVYLMIRIMSSYEVDAKVSIWRKVVSALVVLVTVIVYAYVSNMIIPGFLSKKWIIISSFVVGIPIFMLLVNQRKSNKIMAVYMIILFLGVGGTVNPISKGLNVLYEKPLAREVQLISQADPNGRWLVIGGNLTLPNYIVANGAKTINSVNYYPNIELWEKIDEARKYNNIYNRYAHIVVSLTDEETIFSLYQSDLFTLTLNYNDICILEVNYLLSDSLINSPANEQVVFKMIYNEDDLMIYKVQCHGGNN